MFKTLVKVGGVLVLAAIVGAVVAGEDLLEFQCEKIQSGVWARNGAECITETCYSSGTCRLRAYPAEHCSKIRIGDRISRVVLYLGNPMSSTQDRLQWHWDKTSHGVGIDAEFRHDRLISLNCKAFPSTIP